MFNYINKFNLTFIKKDNYLTMYIVFAYTLLFFSIGENIVNIEFNKNLLKEGVFTDWFLFNQNAIRIAPPLVIENDQIQWVCSKILQVLDRYHF